MYTQIDELVRIRTYQECIPGPATALRFRGSFLCLFVLSVHIGSRGKDVCSFGVYRAEAPQIDQARGRLFTKMPITLQSMKKRLSQYKQEAKRHSLGPDAFNVFKSPARPLLNPAVTGPVNPDDTDHLLRPCTADTGKMSIDPSRPGTADTGMMSIDNVAMTSPMSMDEIVAASPADVDMAASPIHSGTDTAGEQSLLYLAISWGLMARSHDKKAHAEEVYSLGNKIFGTSAWSVNAAESANWALGKVPVPLGRVTVEELRQRSKVRPPRQGGPVGRPQTMLW